MPSATTTDAGTRAGAETIDLQEGNSHGILLLHGFGDTPQTLGLLARHLHACGFDVKAPLLPGHGRSVPAFMASRRADWLACARQELAAIRANHRSVSIVGLSMGGAIAAILAAEVKDITALVLLAPYLDMPVTASDCVGVSLALGTGSGRQKSLESELDSRSGGAGKKPRLWWSVFGQAPVRAMAACCAGASLTRSDQRADAAASVQGGPSSSACCCRAGFCLTRRKRKKAAMGRRRWAHNHRRLRP